MAKKSSIMSVAIVGDNKKFSKSLNDTDSKVGKFQSRLNKMVLPAAAVIAGAAAIGKKLLDAGEAASTANARIGQIAKSMGVFGADHAKVSDRVVKNAEKMARSTGIDPNTIKQGQAVLMTFSEIAKTAGQTGSAFDRANAAAVDLSAAGFGSVESASTMLGKALQDPTRGMTALTRVGVTFTDEQKKQVAALQASGKMLEAQNVVLQAVESQVGGVAEATANGTDKINVQFQLMSEKLGLMLLPILDKLVPILGGVADYIGDNAEAALIFGGIITGLAGAVLLINGAMRAYRAAAGLATAAQWALNTAMKANPIGLIITAIGLLVAAFVWAYENVDWFRDGVDAAMKWISEAVGNVVNWWKDRWDDAIKTGVRIVLWWRDNVQPAIDAVTRSVGGAARWIQDSLGRAFEWAGRAGTNAMRWITDALANVMNWVRAVRDAILRLFSGIQVPGWVRDIGRFVGIGSTGHPPADAMRSPGDEPGIGSTGWMFTPSPTGVGYAPAAQQTIINLTVNAGVVPDPIALGEELVRYISKWKKATGREAVA